MVDLGRAVAAGNTSLRLPGGAEARVTLDDLLAQRTGLTRHAYDEKLEEGKDPSLLRASLAAPPLQCDPRTCHIYQNVALHAETELLGAAAGQLVPHARPALFFPPPRLCTPGPPMA